MEYKIAGGVPVKGNIFSKQIKHGLAYIRVFQDVKVCKSKETLDIFYRFGDFPAKNCMDLFRVYFDTVFRDDKTEKRGLLTKNSHFSGLI